MSHEDYNNSHDHANESSHDSTLQITLKQSDHDGSNDSGHNSGHGSGDSDSRGHISGGSHQTSTEHIQELLQKIKDAFHEVTDASQQSGKLPLSLN